MSNDLRILITAGLNTGKSIGEINTAISGLQKKINKLNLKAQVDQNFTTAINSFIKATEKLRTVTSEQSKIVSETQNVYKRLDGTVETVTQQILKNGEIIQKSKTIHDANKKAINEESTSLENQIRTLKQLEKELEGYTLAKTRASKNKFGEVTGYTNAYKDNNNQTVTVKTDAEGNVQKINELKNFLKQRNDIQKQQEALDRAHYSALQTEKARFEALDKIHYLALKQNAERDLRERQRINKEAEAIDKAHYLALQQNAKRNQDYIRNVAATQQKINDAKSKFSDNREGLASLNELENRLQSIKNRGDFKSPLSDLNNDIKRTISGLNEASKSSQTFGSSLKAAFNSFPIWMITGTAYMAMTNFFTDGVRYVNDLNKELTQLSIVYMEGQDQLGKYVDKFHDLGKEMSITTLELSRGASEFARQGLSQEETFNRMETAVKYAKISNIDFSTSAKILTATVNSMDVDINRAADSFAYLGDATASDASEIGEAMQRVGGTAGSIGVEFEKVSSWIATVSANTRESAFTIGNSIKSIMARVQSMKEYGFDEEDGTQVNEVARALAAVDIQLVDSEGNFRNFGTVMDELGAKWDKLSSREKAYISTTVAGNYQSARFRNLMEDYAQSVELYEGALNSAGIAQQKFELYQQSTEAHLNQLKNAMEDMWSNSFDSNAIRNVIDALTVLVESFDNLGNVLVLTSGLFLAFRYKAIAGFITGAGAAVKSLLTTRAALQGTTSAANGASVAMTRLERSLGLIGIIATVGSLFITAFNGANDAINNSADSIEKLNEKYKDLSDQLDNVSSYYEQNYDAIDTNVEVKNKLFEMQNSLIDTFGQEANGLDLVNGKYEDQIAKLKELNENKIDLEIKENQLAVDSLLSKNYTEPSLVPDVSKRLSDIFSGNNLSYAVGNGAGQGNLNLEQYYKKLKELQNEILNTNEKIFKSQELIPQNSEEWNRALQAVNAELEAIEPLYNQISKLEDLKKKKIEASTLAQQSFNEEQKGLFEDLSNAFSNQPLEEFENSIKSVTSIVNDFDGENVDEIIEQLKQIPNLQGNPEIQNFIQTLAENARVAESSVDGLSTSFDDVMNKILESSDNIELLNKAQEELSENNQLSGKTIQEISKKYDNFIDVTKLNREEILKFIKAKKQESVDFTETERQKTKDLIDQTKARITAYESEMSAIGKLIQTMIDQTGEAIDSGALNEQAQLAAESRIGSWRKVLGDTASSLQDEKDKLAELEGQYETLGNAKDNLTATSNKSDKEQKKSNETLSVTNELLTEQMKKLRELKTALDNADKSKSRFKKGSVEYERALKREIALLERQAELLTEGIKDPSKLVATKVTTTTKGDGSAKGIDSLLTASQALSATNALTYKQVSGKFEGSYDQFIERALSDCSQFVQEMYDEFLGIQLPRTAAEQAKVGTAVTSKKDLQKGDLVFFNTTGKSNSHVGVYMGEGNFMQMGNSGLKQYNLNDAVWKNKYEGARRISGVYESSFSPSSLSGSKVTGKNADLINKYAGANNVDPALIKAIIQQESGNGANGISNVMQVSKLGKNTTVAKSIETGTAMFAKYLNQTGDVDIALAMYNMGPGILDFFNKNGGYSKENMQKFSNLQKKKTGSSVYGDPNYVDNVKSYYPSANSSGDSKVKYTLPSQSEMEETQNNARKERSDTYDEIYQRKIAVVENYVTGSKQKIENLDNLIAKSQGAQSRFDDVSEQWRKEETSQISLIEQKQKELETQNKELDRLVKENKITSGEFDSQKASNSTEWWQLEQEKQEKKYAVITSSLDEYEKKASEVNNVIELSQARLALLAEGTEEYNDEVKNQIDLLNQKKVPYQQELDLVNDLLKSGGHTATQTEDLKERQHQLELALLETNSAIKDQTDALKSAASDALSKYSDAISSVIDSIKDSLGADELFDTGAFSDSVDSILAELDRIDGKYITGAQFIDTSSSARSSLSSYASQVRNIASDVQRMLNYSKDLSNVSFDNLSDFGNQINYQIAAASKLKERLEAINNEIRDTELQYQKEEAALEKYIDSVSKSYDEQIKKQQDLLDKLDEQYELEDRTKALKDINDQINAAKNDKRYSYITEAGEEILTYNKETVKDLEDQKDELVKQYEREDVKQAIQDEIDRLQDAKDKELEILNEKLERTKEIHQQNLAAMQLYKDNLSNMYNQLIADTQAKLDQYAQAITTGMENGSISAAEGSKLLESVVGGWQSSSIAGWNNYITQVKAKLTEIQSLYAQLQKLASSINSISVSSGSGKSSGGSSSSGSSSSGSKSSSPSSGSKSSGSSSGSKNSSGNSLSNVVKSVTDTVKSIVGGTKKYHTGGEVGMEPLGPNEVPAILKKGEVVFTEEHQKMIRKIIAQNVALNKTFYLPDPNKKFKAVTQQGPTSVDSSVTYSINGPIHVNANNATEFYRSMQRTINSKKR
ncbi:phage tail tape measure protein [Paenibacillus medicaginis]|uniref:Phage tail tape measure protein n=1 Tax=Paenibacillus medicaginis TaxID=1470560 RepID=A0ABV5BUZ4_9BACL